MIKKQEERKSENGHREIQRNLQVAPKQRFKTEAVEELLSLWFCVESEHSQY